MTNEIYFLNTGQTAPIQSTSTTLNPVQKEELPDIDEDGTHQDIITGL